jgi:hypothetical protein
LDLSKSFRSVFGRYFRTEDGLRHQETHFRGVAQDLLLSLIRLERFALLDSERLQHSEKEAIAFLYRLESLALGTEMTSTQVELRTGS